jgi:hypothetical protein
MSADARATSHAIQQHVTDELQATNAFDPQITYSKGQAILRMLEAYLGPDVFRSGIRSYIKAHAFSNATTADLWNGSAGERQRCWRHRRRLDRASRISAGRGRARIAIRAGRARSVCRSGGSCCSALTRRLPIGACRCRSAAGDGVHAHSVLLSSDDQQTVDKRVAAMSR